MEIRSWYSETIDDDRISVLNQLVSGFESAGWDVEMSMNTAEILSESGAIFLSGLEDIETAEICIIRPAGEVYLSDPFPIILIKQGDKTVVRTIDKQSYIDLNAPEDAENAVTIWEEFIEHLERILQVDST